MKSTLQHLNLHNIVLGKLDFDQIFQLKNLMLVFLLICVFKILILVYKFLYALIKIFRLKCVKINKVKLYDMFLKKV